MCYDIFVAILFSPLACVVFFFTYLSNLLVLSLFCVTRTLPHQFERLTCVCSILDHTCYRVERTQQALHVHSIEEKVINFIQKHWPSHSSPTEGGIPLTISK
uniref:(northern house mosquito) hypothetical protein n=1 Tax=Culex pipiens TaxID=7175 RepID=A0A8D8KUH9_CULPI